MKEINTNTTITARQSFVLCGKTVEIRYILPTDLITHSDISTVELCSILWNIPWKNSEQECLLLSSYHIVQRCFINPVYSICQKYADTFTCNSKFLQNLFWWWVYFYHKFLPSLDAQTSEYRPSMPQILVWFQWDPYTLIWSFIMNVLHRILLKPKD